MLRPVNILLVGIGGYGRTYLDQVLDAPPEAGMVLAGIVDPYADRCSRLDELKQSRVPVVGTLDAFYAKDRADLVVIASPIHCHCPQSAQALASGANVLCEKPLSGEFTEGRQLAAAAVEAHGFAAIGYQWSFSSGVQALKRDILAGDLGRPLRLKTLCLWPRASSYYARNNWAGVARTSDGRAVYDSPVNNATAHYLHNMLYILGPTRETSDWPVELTAELYRANHIQNFDTGALRCMLGSGAELLFLTTHAVSRQRGPEMVYEFEEATVTYGAPLDNVFVARFRNGSERRYDVSDANQQKLPQCVDSVRSGAPVACPVEAALPQTLCVDGARLSTPDVAEFPPEWVRSTGDTDPLTCVAGLEEALEVCYDDWRLPSETGSIAWARPGRKVDLAAYVRDTPIV